jgi:bile acid:Na+ symporter, BASS family
MDNSPKIYLGIALMIIMIGMGLSLTIQDFKRIFKHPKAVLIGAFNQLIILPLVGFLMVWMYNIRPELAVGMMIIAACPGGPTSNLISHLCKGDVALSVSLTALSSLVTLFSIPLILEFAINYFEGDNATIAINRLDIFKDLVLVTVIPITLGMTINKFKPMVAKKMEKPVKIASMVILFTLIIFLTIKERENLFPYFSEVGLSALTLNIVMLGLGFLSGRLFALKSKQSMTIAIESGIQNGTLAIAIGLGVFQQTHYAIPGAVYSLVMYLTSFVLIAAMSRTQLKS